MSLQVDRDPLLERLLATCEPGPLRESVLAAMLLVGPFTATGQRVRDFLVAGGWAEGRPPLHLTEKVVTGTRCELRGAFESPGSVERVALVYFWEGGALRLHDVFYATAGGVPVERFVSRDVHEAWRAAGGSAEWNWFGDAAMQVAVAAVTALVGGSTAGQVAAAVAKALVRGSTGQG
jgi:hypothetical protein